MSLLRRDASAPDGKPLVHLPPRPSRALSRALAGQQIPKGADKFEVEVEEDCVLHITQVRGARGRARRVCV